MLGPRGKGPVRLRLSAHWDDLSHEFDAGLQQISGSSPFVLDPQIKDEYVYLSPKRTKSSTLLERAGMYGWVSPADGDRRKVALRDPSESMLSQVGEPGLFPELATLIQRMSQWRFFHQFDTGSASELRRPQPGVRSDTLASDGSNLGAAIATLQERGHHRALLEAIDSAFPGYGVDVEAKSGVFSVAMHAPGVRRPLSALELSDGQLRFLCLAVALLSSRPPELLVLNEPENSLHPGAIAALAPLILDAAKYSQVWVTSHSATLCEVLAPHATVNQLTIREGQTTVHQL